MTTARLNLMDRQHIRMHDRRGGLRLAGESLLGQ